MTEIPYAGVAREQKRDLIASEKESGCLCCGEPDPSVLEFHHVERTEKLFSIATAKYKVSLEELVAELAKCVTLCPTCHVRADRGVYEIAHEDPDDERSSYVCKKQRL
jgi:hypothetical protein